MKNRSNIGAYVLIVLGVYFLALKRGWAPNLGYIVSEWWPLILIVVGVSLLIRRSPRE